MDKKKLHKRLGDGNFVFDVDFTGLQSFCELYEDDVPLCTTAAWEVHSSPHLNNGSPYKYNLARIGFVFEDENGDILPSFAVADIVQEKDETTGVLHSRFSVNGCECYVKTSVCAKSATITAEAESSLIKRDRMYVNIVFPYPSPEKNGSDWLSDDRHKSQLRHLGDACEAGAAADLGVDDDEEFNESKVERVIDDIRMSVGIKAKNARIGHRLVHKYFVKANGDKLWVEVRFGL